MIDRTRWQQLSALLDDALALDEPARAPWLAALRRRDASLADDVQRLLAPAADDPALTANTSATASGIQSFGKLLGQALKPLEVARPGQRLGPWELLKKIGEGGMGQVWLARRADGLYEAQAAIKLLRGDLGAAGLAQRFARERAVLARLNHPAVARLLDAGVEQGQVFLVLEFVDGALLADFVRAQCPMVAQRVRLLLRIGEAVDHAHAQLIVHRDLKPSNVLVTHAGEVKLLDFGIAGLLDAGEPVDTELTRQTGRGLTLGYAAPEQILGAPIGTAADVFSLGVMLFELLSGELPFAPRNSPRLVAERAVLHDEPKRLSALLPTLLSASEAAHAEGPGRPHDAARARGDLEAIVAKALRKEPVQRYGSVRALMDDLQHWLAHRPVSARRDDWRHRARLWVRRNGLLAGGLTMIVLSLSAGLATATWQWQRAQAAARQSDQVTSYLTDLLASANPDRHGGQWPTVLQLLESSRASLPGQFRDHPQTRLRLLQVLADTYGQLNRFDVAMPLHAELVLLNAELFGDADRRSLMARYHQARVFQIQGLFDKTIVALEPLRAEIAHSFGASSDELRQLLYVLSASYTRVGRLDQADPMLAEAGRVTQARFAPGSPEWLSHQNHVQVLRVGQGRPREALVAIRATEPYWGDTRPENARQILVFRRNTLAVQIRLSEYEDVEPRALALLTDMDRLLGAGNDMASGLRHELARYYSETGQMQQALAQRITNLARAQAAKVEHPAVLIPLQVQLVLARARAHAAAPVELVKEARALLGAMSTHHDAMGYARADAWVNLARVGLLLDDAALASEALAPLNADTGLQLDRDAALGSRVAQLGGELARLQGDLPRSRSLLQQGMQVYQRPGSDPQLLAAWVVALDLAYTQVLMGDSAAATTLQNAAARRPPGVPRGHTLDAAQAWLHTRLAHGDEGHPAVREALRGLRRTQGRDDAAPAGAGLGSLAGALI